MMRTGFSACDGGIVMKKNDVVLSLFGPFQAGNDANRSIVVGNVKY